VAVPLLVLGIDAGRLDCELDAARVQVVVVGDDGAVEVGELATRWRTLKPTLEWTESMV
jgi:hypothetical protein